MPLAVGGSKNSSTADKSSTTATGGPGGGGRTTFRPPWVKSENSDKPLLKPTVKTAVPPWTKKAATGENGEKSVPAASTAAVATTLAKSSAAPKRETPDNSRIATAKADATDGSALRKTTAPTVTNATIKKAAANLPPTKSNTTTTNAKNLPLKDTKLQSREIKVPITRDQPKVIQEPLKPKVTSTATKKPPPPQSSTSEETTEEETDDEDEEEEEESEEESEEEDKQKQQISKNVRPQQENELQRRFAEEKPKLRPVVVKRDKSLSTVKKRTEAADDDDDNDETVEGETEEERERRLRFKLDKPKLRHVVVNKEKNKMTKSIEDFDKIRPVLKKVPKADEILKEPKEEPKPEFKNKILKKVPSIKREPSKKNVPAPPPLPSMVPKAPPPPPPPLGPPSDFEKKKLSNKQKEVLEKLKIRPRRRPDWSEMMKEVESGRKLRHVECNDRSQPIITCKSMTKVDDKFVYETEKDNSHNKLLKQIQSGVRLKPTQTNDRSKPMLEGLRKFRRQMTIEEQIQKSQSKANLANMNKDEQIPSEIVDEVSSDELDDIDKIRDDLQSTKQMLALELRNREAQDRENKRLLAKIAALEAELQREKSRETNFEYGSNTIIATNQTTAASDEVFVNSLKQEAEQARKINKELEKKYQVTAEELDTAKSEIDEQKRTILQLERKLAQALQGNSQNNVKSKISFCYSFEDPKDAGIYYNSTDLEDVYNHRQRYQKNGGSSNGSRRPSDANANKESSPEFDLGLSESDEDEDEEKKAARKERRLGREIKMLHNKLNKLKDKQETAKKERESLKLAMKKNHVLLKEENKKFKKLEKEVQKMAASMKEDDNDDDDSDDIEKDIEEEEPEDEEEEESEEESESDSDDETGSESESESEPENATNEAKKKNLEPRVKNHENRLSAMKKCNVLLQANVDNIQDEITKIRTKAASLQAELDAVISDLGL